MATAIVCLPSRSKSILVEVKSALNGRRVKTFNDVDDSFDFIWSDGKDVGLFILDLDKDHVEELWHCARNWSSLHFIALHSEDVKLPSILENLSYFSPPDEIQNTIREIKQLASSNHLRIGKT